MTSEMRTSFSPVKLTKTPKRHFCRFMRKIRTGSVQTGVSNLSKKTYKQHTIDVYSSLSIIYMYIKGAIKGLEEPMTHKKGGNIQ